MTPTACQFCVYWRKLRPTDCNWGICQKIVPLDEITNETKAYFHVVGSLDTNVSMNTLETFYCSSFVRAAEHHQPTIVDKVRAGLALKQKTTGQ